jgi:hypothetical protein
MEAPPLKADADVRNLPHGTPVGAWRLQGCRGLGVYGTVYRAVPEGHTEAGIVALKLAIYPRDARFKREAELLRSIRHPSVPQLLDSGSWRHPNGFSYPFLVMEWVEGEPLYEWASRRNPSQRQVLRLLAQTARALQATHAAGGVHRDVKGDNVLVRPADGRLFLMDFGAGHYEGAERLTSSPLPPGTPAYRSPEAWAHGRRLGPRPLGLYVAGPADDVFALGVMAYRLVTDEYPPFTDASMEEGRCWQPGGSGPLPPREVNPRVGAILDAVIRRMLPLKPEERGTPEELAQEMERRADQAGPEVGEELFEWETLNPAEWPAEDVADAEHLGHRARRRDKDGGRVAAEADAARRAEHQQSRSLTRAEARVKHGVPRERTLARPLWLAVVVMGVALVLWPREREPESTAAPFTGGQGSPAEERRDGGVTYVGDTALTSTHAFVQTPSGKGVALEVPPRPLPGQLRPDGNGRCQKGLVAINGGCWKAGVDLDDCKRDGSPYYVYKAICYVPIFPPAREPTSAPVEPAGPER